MQQRNRALPSSRPTARSLLAVAAGGFLGATARIILAALIPDDPSFPATTLSVNVLGTALLGFFSVYFAVHQHLPAWWRAGIGTGFLGAFTTFSTIVIFLLGVPLHTAVIYAGLSLVLCGLAAWLVMVIAERYYRGADRTKNTDTDSNTRTPDSDPGDAS